MTTLVRKALFSLMAIATIGSATTADARTCFQDCRNACRIQYPGDEEAQQDCLEACLIANCGQ